MKSRTKKLFAAILCLCLLFTTAFASSYTPYEENTAEFSHGDVVSVFDSLAKDRIGAIATEGESYSSGYVYVCADAFVLGGDYIIYPMKVELAENDTAASVFLRALDQCGMHCEYDGSADEDFYLSRIWGVDLTPSPEEELVDWLKPIVSYYDLSEWQMGGLGEFDFTDMSGWMFYVNGEMPSVAMSGYEPQEGDVISLSFTLAYGMDLGASSFIDGVSPYTEAVNRAAVAKAIAEGNLSYSDCAGILSSASATQEDIDGLLRGI